MVKRLLLKMGKPMLNKSGFTMIETLFVLMIMCMLFCLSMNIHIPQKSHTKKIEEITHFLYQAKLSAMSQKHTVTVTFSSNDISFESNDVSHSFLLDDNDSFEEYQLSFNLNGNISGAKTLTYHCGNQTYEFVYQIGSGTFYVR